MQKCTRLVTRITPLLFWTPPTSSSSPITSPGSSPVNLVLKMFSTSTTTSEQQPTADPRASPGYSPPNSAIPSAPSAVPLCVQRRQDGSTFYYLQGDTLTTSYARPQYDGVVRSPVKKGSDKFQTTKRSLPEAVFHFLFQALWQHLLVHLLPRGYPTTVRSGYINYVSWNALQNVCGAMAGVLSTQALLQSVGVGAPSALPVAATLSWILRENVGQLGGVIFAARAKAFDSRPKRANFYGIVLIDFSCLLELLTALFPGYFLILASLANVGKNIACIALSSTRAAIHQSFTACDNLADVTAKSTSQAILSTMLGTALGCMLVARSLSPQGLLFPVFGVLAVVQMYAAYRALLAVVFRVLNARRLDAVLDHWWTKHQMISPEKVGATERFVIVDHLMSTQDVNVGTDLSRLGLTLPQLQSLLKQLAEEPFVIILQGPTQTRRRRSSILDHLPVMPSPSAHSPSGSSVPVKVFLLIADRATPSDVLRGYFTAKRALLETQLRSEGRFPPPSPDHRRFSNGANGANGRRLSTAAVAAQEMFLHDETEELALTDAALRAAKEHTTKHFPAFLALLAEKGWHTEFHHLEASPNRISIGSGEQEEENRNPLHTD